MLGCYAETPIAELAKTTGLPAARVETIVHKLAQLGLIDAPAAAEAHPDAGDDLVALLDSAMFDLFPPAEGAAEAPSSPAAEEKPRAVPVGDTPTPLGRTTRPRPVEGRPDDGAPAEAAEAPVVELGGVAEPADPAETAETTREYKKLFETEIHPLPVDQRVALAATATGARLFALCFDPEPVVISAMFENTGTTAEHARLIAFHHRGRGLDEIRLPRAARRRRAGLPPARAQPRALRGHAAPAARPQAPRRRVPRDAGPRRPRADAGRGAGAAPQQVRDRAGRRARGHRSGAPRAGCCSPCRA